MNSEAVFSRTVNSWRLALMHSGKALHFLTRAVLLTLASAGMGFGWLCCWLDHFRSCSHNTGWMIPGQAVRLEDQARHSDAQAAAVEVPRLNHLQPRGVGVRGVDPLGVDPRSIDSLLRGKSARA